MANVLTKRLERIGLFFELLSEGKKIDEISDIMGLENDELLKLKKDLIEEKSSDIKNKPIEHVYFEYFLNQLDNINELTNLILKFDGNSRNYGGVVSAIRARSEIYDKILDRGQNLGVIKKTPSHVKNEHSVLIADLSSNELRKAIVEQYRKIAKLTSETVNDNIVNIPIGPLHYGDEKALPEVINIEQDKVKVEYIKPKKKKKKKKKKNEEI
ncbi:MAG: hypothetical protein BV456_00725 [Thermoplasmata archaeon M8B2D]|nr:MAG: hypothetical protein BV456_00725 [Thermoplasmata archaeon M8B2D]